LTSVDEALAAAIITTSQAPPLRSDLKFLQQWLSRPSLGASALEGRDHDLWDITPVTDLVSLSSRTQDDAISRFLLGPFIAFYHRCCSWHRLRRPLLVKPSASLNPLTGPPNSGVDVDFSLSLSSTATTVSSGPKPSHSKESDLEAQPCSSCPYVEYDDRRLFHIATIIGTMLASLLPILSIIVLYFIQDFRVRLSIVTLFTLAFTVALRLFTQAKTGELFAATSAWVLSFERLVMIC
jgi:hypothetical protein